MVFAVASASTSAAKVQVRPAAKATAVRVAPRDIVQKVGSVFAVGALVAGLSMAAPDAAEASARYSNAKIAQRGIDAKKEYSAEKTLIEGVVEKQAPSTSKVVASAPAPGKILSRDSYRKDAVTPGTVFTS